MNATKLTEARDRLEMLYWDCHRNGGPDLELLCILRLVEEAAVPAPDEDRYEPAPELVILTLDPPGPRPA